MTENKELIANLRSEDVDIVKESLEKIGDLDLKEAIPSIMQLINENRDIEIIDTAIWTLSRVADPDIIAQLLNHNDRMVVLNAIEALGRMEVENVGKYVGIFLNHKDPDFRAMTTWVIGKSMDDNYYDKIIDLLQNDEDPEVRSNAAWTLKKLNKPESLEILKERLQKEKDSIVPYNIVEAINSIERSMNDSIFDFNIYTCELKSDDCNNIEKDTLKFSDKNVEITIELAKNCDKAKICGVHVIKTED